VPLDAFAQELIGLFPDLSILPARSLVNRAWQDIRDMRLWSFLVAEGPLVVPNVVSNGSVTVTLGSTAVVGDATAAAVWITLAFANPPLASPNIGTARQFRLGQGNPVYNIIAFDGVNTITLDRPYVESSLAGQSYQIYRAYYQPPSADFYRYFSITNVALAYSIVGKSLTFNREELDLKDPQRGAQGDAYILGSYKPDPTTSIPVHELWPNPVNANTYLAIYQRRGLAMTPTGVTPVVDYPPTLSSSLLMARAEYRTAQWAVQNMNRYKDLKGINWFQVRKDATSEFREEFIQQARIDMEIFKNSWVLPKGTYLGFPVDAAFIQSHDVDLMFLDVG
jgi:hypothetical protein